METAARPVAVATDADRAIATDTATLRKRPSALIRLTVDDLRDALYSGSYAWDPAVWHSPELGRKAGKECAICLGGARLAGTLGFPPAMSVGTTNPGLDDGEDSILAALDLFRLGVVDEAFAELGIDAPHPRGRRFNRQMPVVWPSPAAPEASEPNIADPLLAVGPLCHALVALAADLEQGGY